MILIKKDLSNINLNQFEPLRRVVKAKLTRSIIQDDYVDISVESTKPIKFNIGDKIIVEGRDYFLNLNPKTKKSSTRNFLYDVRFEGVAYLLRKTMLFNRDTQGRETDFNFSLTTDLKGFLQLVLNNANHNKSIWELGSYKAVTEIKTLSFNNENCLLALQEIIEAYETEFDFTYNNGKYVLNARDTGTHISYNFEYGKGLGLYALSRQNASDKEVVTRMYAFGSSENLPIGYRDYSPRLRMGTSDYIENSALIEEFGLVEDIHEFDIKPEFFGDVTSLGDIAQNTVKFSSTDMNFDLKSSSALGSDYLIDGQPAIISFLTGKLAGYEFEVSDYDHTTKEFTLIKKEDDREVIMPDDNAFKIQIGDSFTILQIRMPSSYINVAQVKLRAEATKLFNKLSQNNIKYDLDIDPIFMREKSIGLGDRAFLKDTQLGVNQRIKVIKIEHDLLNDKIRLELSNLEKLSLISSPQFSLQQNIKDIDNKLQQQKKKIIAVEKETSGIKEDVDDIENDIDDIQESVVKEVDVLPPGGGDSKIYILGDKLYIWKDNSWTQIGGDNADDIIDDTVIATNTAFSSDYMLRVLKEWGISDYSNRLNIKTPNIN